MAKKFFLFLQSNKDKLFAWIVSLYIYILYMRFIYLSFENVCERIDNDYYRYVLNKKQWWLTQNNEIYTDIIIMAGLTMIILISFYLIYKKKRYFYAVLLSPIFLGLAFMMITPLYVLLNSI